MLSGPDGRRSAMPASAAEQNALAGFFLEVLEQVIVGIEQLVRGAADFPRPTVRGRCKGWGERRTLSANALLISRIMHPSKPMAAT